MITRMSYTTDDFIHNTPPRIMGSETEYTMQQECITRNTKVLDSLNPAKFLCKFSPDSENSIWLKNGARLYVDYGDLCEYATPESTTAHEVCAHERAGEITVQQVTTTSNPGNDKVYKRTGYDDVYGDDGTQILSSNSAGHHENYYTPLAQTTEKLYAISALHSYLATRPIWSGAGMVGEFGYLISQKADAINYESKSNAVDHGNKMPHRLGANNRLEIRTGEGNMSDWAIIQKFAMTSLILRLIEHGRFPHHLIPRTRQTEPTQLMRYLSYNPSASFQIGDYEMTAAQHQKQLAEHAYDFAMEHITDIPVEEVTAAEEVLEACRQIDLVHDHSLPLHAIADRIDWAAKLLFLHDKGIYDSQIKSANLDAVMFDLRWEDISKRGISRLWYAKYQKPLLKPAEINRAEYTPPATRAATRVKLVREAIDRCERTSLVDWNTIELGSGLRSLSDPYQSD